MRNNGGRPALEKVEIRKYKCTFFGESGLNQELADRLGLKFPDAYMYAESMCKIALAVKEQSGMGYCIVPFCHTIEAESMGGIINYGDAVNGPRPGGYVCETADDLLKLPDIDFSKGRMSEVLRACQLLRQQGEDVILQLTGPFTLLNSLMDSRHIFKLFRKQPDEMMAVLVFLERNLLSFADAALKCGVNLLCYADPGGEVSIIGPERAVEFVKGFTYPLLKKIEDLIGGKAVTVLCPGTAFALIDTKAAVWGALNLGEVLPFSFACVRAVGKANFIGEVCMKNGKYMIKDGKLKTLELV